MAKRQPTLRDLALADSVLDFIDEKALFNYFTHTPAMTRLADPYEEFVQLCRTNLGFAARAIIGKGEFQLMPFQVALLEIMWDTTFPILVMTRGGGKCSSANTLLFSSKGIERADEILPSKTPMEVQLNIPLYGEKQFQNTAAGIINPKEPLVHVRTRFGFDITGTKEHPIRVISKEGEIEWKRLDQITTKDYICIYRDDIKNWGSNNFSKDDGYLIGTIIGDGSLAKSNKSSIRFTSFDYDIVDEFKRIGSKYGSYSKHKTEGLYALNFGSRQGKLDFLNLFSLKECTSHYKEIPYKIRISNRNCMIGFIQGYADTDGGVTGKGVEFSSASKELLRQLQVILCSYGIISKRRYKKIKYKDSSRDAWILSIHGTNAEIFKNRIGFRCKRKQDALEEYCKKDFNTNIDMLHNCKDLLHLFREELKAEKLYDGTESNTTRRWLAKWYIEKYNISYKKLDTILSYYDDASHLASWKKLDLIREKNIFFCPVTSISITKPQVSYDVHVPNGNSFWSNGMMSHNTTLLAVYALLRSVLDQNKHTGQKVVLIAPSFRQSKLIMEEAERLYSRSPILQACSTDWYGVKKNNDKWEMKLGNSTITAVPLGDGSKIRGLRASKILCDEMKDIPEDIFNVVVRGFAAVSSNPVDRVRSIKNRKKMKEIGIDEKKLAPALKGNQIIRSGTAGYEFNHFYQLFCQYKNIIENKLIGNKSDPQIAKILGEDIGGSGKIDYRNFAVIQIPHTALPEGYMDQDMIDEGALTMTRDEFDMEYNAKFITDSIGFFKASALKNATPMLGDRLYFDIELEGNPNAIYVMGIDPARLQDDFALVILKVLEDRHQLVYAERWNKKNFGVIAKRIRELVKLFNIQRIGIDKFGGGTAILDFLQTPEMVPKDEVPFWEVNEKTTQPGLKILDLVNYMGRWLVEANYDLCADIEHRRLIFPGYLNEQKWVEGSYKDVTTGQTRLNLDLATDIFELINECKRQLAQIQITATDKSETEHFDVPEDVKWKQKKDLYSALLIAAYEARQVKLEKAKAAKMTDNSIGGSILEFI